MAEQIRVFGAATIRVSNDGGALETLTTGGTRNGAQVTYNGFFADVFADVNGGDEGPPIDTQYFGETARIFLLLTKWDEAVALRIRSRLNTVVTPGVIPTAGFLMFQDGASYRVLINAANGIRNFPRCIFREPIEINKGTKHSTLILVAEAHRNSVGVLWNTETGG